MTENNPSENEKVFTKFSDIVEEKKRTIKDAKLDKQLELGHYPVKQKARPKPPHLQEDMRRKLEIFIIAGHLDNTNNVNEGCFTGRNYSKKNSNR